MMSNFGQLGSQMMRGAAMGQELQVRSEQWELGETDRAVKKEQDRLALAEHGVTGLARQASTAMAAERRLKQETRRLKNEKLKAEANKANAMAFKYANRTAATGKTGTATVTTRNWEGIGKR